MLPRSEESSEQMLGEEQAFISLNERTWLECQCATSHYAEWTSTTCLQQLTTVAAKPSIGWLAGAVLSDIRLAGLGLSGWMHTLGIPHRIRERD